jgi:hypothetical protein
MQDNIFQIASFVKNKASRLLHFVLPLLITSWQLRPTQSQLKLLIQTAFETYLGAYPPSHSCLSLS